MDEIPLVDLKKQYLSIKKEIDKAIQGVIDETAFIMGDHVKGFEESFASIFGVGYAVGASSGTAAIFLALEALDIGEGDEVITVANTFIATTEAISSTGARVVFVDVDERTFNIDVARLEERITEKTKAIVPVHLYGQAADMDVIMKIAKRHELKVVEDASQSHLAEFNGKKVGTFGDAACFSFYPGKNLGAYGDAGMVTTSSSELADRIRKLSDHGRINKYEYVMEGYNFRLDALQAAILKVKLKYLPEWTEKRRAIAQAYNGLLQNLDIVTPYVDPRCKHVYHLYVVRTKVREQLKEALTKEGISTGIHYPIPLHLQKAYKYLGYKKGDFPVSEECSREILSLPIFPELTDEEVNRVANIVKHVCKKG